jgi:hypothetical protein
MRGLSNLLMIYFIAFPKAWFAQAFRWAIKLAILLKRSKCKK